MDHLPYVHPSNLNGTFCHLPSTTPAQVRPIRLDSEFNIACCNSAMALMLNDLNDDVLIELYKWVLEIAWTSVGPFDQEEYLVARTGLSCTNKRFRSLALPFLFKYVTLEGMYELNESRARDFISVFGGNEALRGAIQ